MGVFFVYPTKKRWAGLPWKLRPQVLGNTIGLEVEADAEGNAADIAFLAHHAAEGLAGDHLSGGVSVLVEGLLRVVDGVGTKTIVVEAGADMAAEVGAEAEHPGEGDVGFVGVVECAAGGAGAFAFAGDHHHVGADAEFTIGGDVVPEFVVEVADTGHDGDVEVGGGGVVVVHVLVAPGAADHIPEEVGLSEGGHHAHAHVEAVAGAIAGAESEGGIIAPLLVTEGYGVVGVDSAGKVARGQVAIEEDGLAELRLCCHAHADHQGGEAHHC